MVNWLLDGLEKIIDGWLGGIVDWAINFFGNIKDKLVLIVDAIFSIFDNVPRILKGFDKLLGTVLWFVPSEAFPVIYMCLGIIFIMVLWRWLFKK